MIMMIMFEKECSNIYFFLWHTPPGLFIITTSTAQHVPWDQAAPNNRVLKISAYLILYTIYCNLVCYSEKGTIWCEREFHSLFFVQ